MLSPDSRTVAFDLLRPPADYNLDFALVTTYTLNLEALLALPLGLVARADNGLEDLLADPLLLLEALRRAGERIHVFVDRAGIAIPRKRRELYAMLEPSVHPVRAPGGGASGACSWRQTARPASSSLTRSAWGRRWSRAASSRGRSITFGKT